MDKAAISRAPASITDVAKLAGVSPQTASRVSLGRANVSPQTRERVQDAMRQLNYVPNQAARALRKGSYNTIGLVGHHLYRTGDSRLVSGIVDAARTRGYAVTILDLPTLASDAVGQASSRMATLAVDGLIVDLLEDAPPELLRFPAGLPVVVSDPGYQGALPTVAVNDADGTRQAVEYLLGLGHRTVHHIAGPLDTTPAQRRVAAWRQALADHGRPIPEVVPGGWTMADGYRAGLEIVALLSAGLGAGASAEPGTNAEPRSKRSSARRANSADDSRAILGAEPRIVESRVTAVLCANDRCAIGLLRAVHEAGFRVPDDVSVVGFDGIDVTEFTWPPLTTVDQSLNQAGAQIVELLQQQIEAGTLLPGERRELPVHLIVRESTAPPSR